MTSTVKIVVEAADKASGPVGKAAAALQGLGTAAVAAGDDLAREAGSFQSATAAVDGLTRSLTSSAADARVRLLADEMNRLGREVAKGNISVEDARGVYAEFERSLARVEVQAEETGQALTPKSTSIREAWAALATPINQTIEILARVAQAAQKAYAVFNEGLDMSVTADQFARLAAAASTTGDALINDLRTATRGTVADFDLMRSAAEMLSLGLTKTHDETVRLTSVAGKLGWDMQVLTLTLANQSTARLDSLGLSMEGVVGRARQLEAAGYAVDEAFKLAVIEAGEQKIRLLGDTAETAAGKMAVLETNSKNFYNALKMSFSGELFGEIEADFASLFKTADGASGAGEVVGKWFSDMITHGGPVAGTLWTIKEALQETLDTQGAAAQATAAYNQRVAELRDTLIAAGAIEYGPVTPEQWQEQQDALASYHRKIQEANETLYEQSDAYAELQERMLANNNLVSAGEALVMQGNAAMWASVAATAAAAEAEAERERVLEEAAEAQAKYTAAVGDYFAQAARAGNELALFTHNLDQLGERTYFVSNLTRDQRDELARMERAYGAASTAVRDYELGLKGASLSEEERGRRIQEQQDLMATLAENMQPLLDAGGEYNTVNNALTFSTSAVSGALYDLIAASDGSAESMVAAGLALGVFDEAAAEAYLKSAILQGKLGELRDAFLDGAIGPHELREQMLATVTSVEEMFLVMADTGAVGIFENSLDGTAAKLEFARGEAEKLHEQVMGLAGDYDINFNINQHGDMPAIPAGSNSEWSAPPPAVAMAQGGVVRGGIPGRDSVHALLMPDERVLTPAQNQLWEAMMQADIPASAAQNPTSNVTNNYTLNVAATDGGANIRREFAYLRAAGA